MTDPDPIEIAPIDVAIDRLGHLGDGVADTPSGPLYVAGALPGEMVRGRREGERLEDVAILVAAPERVVPACRHFGACGGCATQHAGDDLLARWKTAMAAAALASQGLEAPIRPIAVSPPGSRRRVALSGRRTKKTTLLGFHGRADAAVTPVSECPVARGAIVAALPALREMVGHVASRSGEARVAATDAEAGLDVALSGQKPLDAALRATLAAMAEAADFARLTYNGEPVADRRPPFQRFGAALVTPPPDGFLQATAEGEAALVAAVLEAVGDAPRVADLYAGSGTFTLPLAARATTHAVEESAAALAALDAGWRLAKGLRTVSTEARDLDRRPLRPAELGGYDAVVFDPPRAGAAAQAAQLALPRGRGGPTRIAAASCNPATFARDARTLVDGGWRLEWVQPVDQFRWSPHVELAAAFTRG
ncbi:class I SAM-dependent RNA methyltransferase [Rubrimonas cliftonensis]|uniref:23S rRNA m(5)U-1939 methyltransferase n=1 Tax=Rubrimonas cliftonensis TaxID=89524 RepID=A0A1H4CL09_9RHOB|nr:class I SAM-dependent RNA methyltransferase [Rubrimonas cliftonensis]SEA61024.1 23S rRNA m(5)U-1939 methyltransferase [Rubrimonas cliftonensis]